MMLESIETVRNRKTGRVSSHDTMGGNADWWVLGPGETRVLADLRGPGRITHIWMTQSRHYRELLLKITWDGEQEASVLSPLGDFFCLGHGMVNSFQSLLFSTSSNQNMSQFSGRKGTPPIGGGCALNCYVPMPFRKRAKIELINESNEPHTQYFYIDYESVESIPADAGYFHAEYRRTNPFGGWGPQIKVNSTRSNVQNRGKLAWDNNYVILETKGQGHYLGCNLSVTNMNGEWWGEGDDMIWVDGYKWPPDIHGTGSEDYLGQAYGMQPNAFLRNGSSIFEHHTGGYQTSYVFHLENPVRFNKDIRVTIEHGHANHLGNEMSSVAYWYSKKPTRVATPPPAPQRLPVLKDGQGKWIVDGANQLPGKAVRRSDEMEQMLIPKTGRTLRIKKIRSRVNLNDIAACLGKRNPLRVGSTKQVGEVRLGVVERSLVLHVRVFDLKIARYDTTWWQGSAVELFAAAAKTSEVTQIVFLPSDGKRVNELRFFRNGNAWAGNSPANGIQWMTTQAKHGYELSALIPLDLLGIKAGARVLFLDVGIDMGADQKGAPQRGGTLGWSPDYMRATAYHRLTFA